MRAVLWPADLEARYQEGHQGFRQTSVLNRNRAVEYQIHVVVLRSLSPFGGADY